MAAHLIGLDRGILFLDEIDKLELGAGEILHCAIIEGYVPIVLEEWGTVRDKEIELSPFTVIAASSHVELVAERVGKLFANELYLV
jgi:Holliday junction resolvasome RuvABC ATP-dependent DNA helicase subunit